MDAKQELKLNMYRVTEQHCDENSSIISQTPAFQNAFTQFKARIAEIIATTQLAETALEGIAVDKSVNKKELSRITTDLAGLIYAYAEVQNDGTLKGEVNYSFSALYRSKDDELTPRCETIHGRGTTNIAALTDYGITQDKLDELENAIRNYSQEVPKPRTAISERKTHKQNQRRTFKEADVILKNQMDKLVVNFKADNPDFVGTYKNGRIIIDPATTTTELRGTITSKTDERPIKKATVEIVELSKSTITNSARYYQLKPVTFGTFTVKMTADDYAEFILDDVELKLGVINRLDVDNSVFVEYENKTSKKKTDFQLNELDKENI